MNFETLTPAELGSLSLTQMVELPMSPVAYLDTLPAPEMEGLSVEDLLRMQLEEPQPVYQTNNAARLVSVAINTAFAFAGEIVQYRSDNRNCPLKVVRLDNTSTVENTDGASLTTHGFSFLVRAGDLQGKPKFGDIIVDSIGCEFRVTAPDRKLPYVKGDPYGITVKIHVVDNLTFSAEIR